MALKEHGGFNKVLLKNTGAVMTAPERLGNSTIKRFKHALFCKLFKELKRVAKEPKRTPKIHTKRPNIATHLNS